MMSVSCCNNGSYLSARLNSHGRPLIYVKLASGGTRRVSPLYDNVFGAECKRSYGTALEFVEICKFGQLSDH
jgi:hypothetical protein